MKKLLQNYITQNRFYIIAYPEKKHLTFIRHTHTSL